MKLTPTIFFLIIIFILCYDIDITDCVMHKITDLHNLGDPNDRAVLDRKKTIFFNAFRELKIYGDLNLADTKSIFYSYMLDYKERAALDAELRVLTTKEQIVNLAARYILKQ